MSSNTMVNILYDDIRCRIVNYKINTEMYFVHKYTEYWKGSFCTRIYIVNGTYTYWFHVFCFCKALDIFIYKPACLREVDSI